MLSLTSFTSSDDLILGASEGYLPSAHFCLLVLPQDAATRLLVQLFHLLHFARQLCLYRSLRMILPKPLIFSFQMLFLPIGIVQQQAKGLHSWHDSPLGFRRRGCFPDRPPNVTIHPQFERLLNFQKASASTSLLNPITQQVQRVHIPSLHNRTKTQTKTR